VGVRLAIPFVLILAGCGSSWTIRAGEELSVGCPLYNFYPDADGDGWGDGTEDPVTACEPDNQAGITSKNGRDCDDGDETITGKVGSQCPYELVDDMYAGVVFEGSEFAIIYGDADSTTRATTSEDLCKSWSGRDEEGFLSGGLATFSSAAELQDVTDAVEAAVGDSAFVGFVGLAWDGTSNDDGSWQWTNEEADESLIESQLNWCGGVEPAPLDRAGFYVPGNPDHAAGANITIETTRLALVLDEAGNWCLGSPHEVDEPDEALAEAYSMEYAHFICQRQKPTISDWDEPFGL
jgi:hypothetical protein